MPVVDRGAPERRGPRRVRGSSGDRGADDRRVWSARGPRRSWSCRPGSRRPARTAERSRRSCGTPRSDTKIPVLGPNVEGFVNYVDHVAPYGTTPPPDPIEGTISVISQSGTVAWTMNQMASDRGVGLRIILGVGNEAVLGLGDLFAWAADDPATRVVASYIETMRDVEGIGRGLDALRAARKPVLICAPEGRSEAALRSIVAHTGALAGNTALRDAWLRGHGVVLVDDPVIDVRGRGAALARAAAADAGCGGRAPVRRRVHVVRRGGRRSGAPPPGVRARDEACAEARVAGVRVAATTHST